MTSASSLDSHRTIHLYRFYTSYKWIIISLERTCSGGNGKYTTTWTALSSGVRARALLRSTDRGVLHRFPGMYETDIKQASERNPNRRRVGGRGERRGKGTKRCCIYVCMCRCYSCGQDAACLEARTDVYVLRMYTYVRTDGRGEKFNINIEAE